MPGSTVGARLVLTGKAQFVAGADESAAAVDKLTASLERLGEAGGAAGAGLEASGVGAAGAGDLSKASAGQRDLADATLASSAASLEQAKNASKAKQAVSDAEKGLRDATASAKNYQGVLSNFAGNAGVKRFALFGGVAELGTIYEGVKSYTAFQNQMTSLVTLAGLPKNQLPGLSKDAIGISKSTGINVQNIADQFYRIKSATAGLKETNNQLASMASNTAKLSVLLQLKTPSDYDQAGRILGAILISGKQNKLQGTGSPQHIAAMVAAAVGAGDIKGSQITGSLGRGVLQVGESLHMQLPDILSMISLSTRFAANPSTAGTLISHFLNQMATPSEQGAKAEGMVGIAPGELMRVMQTPGKGLPAAIQLLQNSMKSGLAAGSTSLANYPAFAGNPAGPQSAVAQLQAWGMKMTPQMYQQFISDKLSPANANFAASYLATKIMGGARQEIPWLTGSQNIGMLNAIEALIKKDSTQRHFNALYQTQMNTPYQKQQKGLNDLRLALMSIGKDATGFYTKALGVLGMLGYWLGKNSLIAKTIIGGLGGAVLFSTLAIALKGITKFMAPFTRAAFGIFGKEAPAWLGGTNTSAVEAAQIQLEAARMQLRAAGVETDAADKSLLGGEESAAGGTKLGALGKYLPEAMATLFGAYLGKRFGADIFGTHNHPNKLGRQVLNAAHDVFSAYNWITGAQSPAQARNQALLASQEQQLLRTLGSGKYAGYSFNQKGYIAPGTMVARPWSSASNGVSSAYASSLQDEQNNMRATIQHLKNIDASTKTSSSDKSKNQQSIENLQTEIARLSAAISSFANKPLTVSTTTLAQGAAKGNASQFARGVGGGPKTPPGVGISAG